MLKSAGGSSGGLGLARTLGWRRLTFQQAHLAVREAQPPQETGIRPLIRHQPIEAETLARKVKHRAGGFASVAVAPMRAGNPADQAGLTPSVPIERNHSDQFGRAGRPPKDEQLRKAGVMSATFQRTRRSKVAAIGSAEQVPHFSLRLDDGSDHRRVFLPDGPQHQSFGSREHLFNLMFDRSSGQMSRERCIEEVGAAPLPPIGS